jgi:hypothetical protein
MKTLKTSGTFQMLLDYHWRAIRWNFVTLVFALFIAVWQYNAEEIYIALMSNSMLALGFGSLLTTYRVIHLFKKAIEL